MLVTSYNHKEKINFDFFKELPLDEVAKCLGMYPSKGGKYRSPLHTDVNPSLTIQMDGRTGHLMNVGEQ